MLCLTRSVIRCFSAALFLAISASYPNANATPKVEANTPWVGAAGVQVKTSDIQNADAIRQKQVSSGEELPAEHHYVIHRAHGELTQNPDSPDSPVWPPDFSTNGGPVTSDISQSFGLNFTGATLNDTRAYPPDTMGAVGPTQFIVAVNGRIRTFDKATGTADGVINADTDVFFNSVMTPPATNNFTSDPRIRYDRLTGRWFIIIIDVPGAAGTLPNRVLLAVSDTSTITPSTLWTFFQFQHDLVSPAGDTGKFADYPTLGVDANALYIGVNIFNTSGTGSFYNTTAFVVRKSSILGAGPIVVTAFRKLIGNGTAGGPYTPQGVDNFDPNATEGYLIGVDGSYYGKLDLRRVSNPGGTPTISGNIQITVPLNGGTIKVPHLGNTGGSAGTLDGLDYRLIAAMMRNGRLWTSANVAVDNTGAPGGTDTRMAVRWYELSNLATGQTPAVVQSGTIFQPSATNTTDQRCFWMGSVMVTGQGHAVAGFSVAGQNEYINAGVAARLATDPLGTMQPPLLYTASSSAYNPTDSGGAPIDRWGDYSYTSLDPNDDMTVWTIQEFCNAANSYGVQVLKVLAPPPATPNSCSPNSALQGANNVNITVVGVSTNGSGYFDPGTNFPNHISATISGTGVTVSQVQYINPTNITLKLNVAQSATPGSRTITVINPDGQIVTSATALFTVLGSSNQAPVLNAISSQTINEQSLLGFVATASDADGNALSFSLDPGAPTGASITTNGSFTWTPTESQGPSTNSITVRVTDNGTPPFSDTKTFTVTVNEVNVAPVLASISDRTINESSAVIFTNSAADSDFPANTLTYSFGPNTPAGASLDSTNGVFTWTPTEGQGPGVYSITIVVSDNASSPLSDSKTFTVTVLETNSPPVLAALANRTISEGTTLTFTNFATDADLPENTLAFSLATNAPSGASIDSATGVFTWTPSEAQGPSTNAITVRVTDNGSPAMTDTKTFSVVVTEVNSAPTLASIANQAIHAGMTVVMTNSASDTDIPANTLSFSLEAGAPTGALINPTNGVFSWATTDADANTTNTVTVRVTDNGSPTASDTRAFTITVAPAPVETLSVTNTTVTLTWTAITGRTYTIQYKTDLNASGWTDLSQATAVSSTVSITDTPGTQQRYYRIVAL